MKEKIGLIHLYLNLNKAYSEDEPDYSLSMIKEPNPEYKK
jgi:hypothetical protein